MVQNIGRKKKHIKTSPGAPVPCSTFSRTPWRTPHAPALFTRLEGMPKRLRDFYGFFTHVGMGQNQVPLVKNSCFPCDKWMVWICMDVHNQVLVGDIWRYEQNVY